MTQTERIEASVDRDHEGDGGQNNGKKKENNNDEEIDNEEVNQGNADSKQLLSLNYMT